MMRRRIGAATVTTPTVTYRAYTVDIDDEAGTVTVSDRYSGVTVATLQLAAETTTGPGGIVTAAGTADGTAQTWTVRAGCACNGQTTHPTHPSDIPTTAM